MDGWKFYISAGLFIGVTVMKLLFPDHTEQLRKDIVTVIDMDMNYAEAVQAVGTLLTDDAISAVLQKVDGSDEVQSVYGADDDLPLPTVQCIEPSPSPMLLGEREVSATASDKVQHAVDVFLAEQEAYSAYDIPQNVSYDAVHIPFEYAEPVAGICSSGFGYRVHPIEDRVMFHYGTDYDVMEGTKICSFADGEVTMVGEEAGYGKYLIVTHKDGWKSLYAHCSEVLVLCGEQVQVGERIALSGQTGRVTGPHLHFELTHDAMYTNPEFYFYESDA